MGAKLVAKLRATVTWSLGKHYTHKLGSKAGGKAGGKAGSNGNLEAGLPLQSWELEAKLGLP